MPVSRSLQGMTASTRRGLEPPVENGSKKHLPIEAARYRFDFEQTFDHRFRSSCEQPDSRIAFSAANDQFWLDVAHWRISTRLYQAGRAAGSFNTTEIPLLTSGPFSRASTVRAIIAMLAGSGTKASSIEASNTPPLRSISLAP